MASDDTVNPMRGYHRWFNLELVPHASPALVAYNRYAWRDLESSQDVYDFSAVLAKANAAKAAGQKFAFRVAMMKGYGDSTLYLPAYLYKNVACTRNCGFWTPSETAASRTFVPDWNDTWLQTRAKKMLTALRDQLATTGVELAWIDVGLYGQYGEWYLDTSLYSAAPTGITFVTESSKQAFARMFMDVFPDEQLVVFALWAQRSVLSWELTQSITTKPVGLRTDCLGRDWVLGEWRRTLRTSPSFAISGKGRRSWRSFARRIQGKMWSTSTWRAPRLRISTSVRSAMAISATRLPIAPSAGRRLPQPNKQAC